jgi:AcrR family transcriptional regulator
MSSRALATAQPRVAPSASAEAPTPIFRRARAEDALEVAFETFLSEARVDMQTLAAQLDVSPATLYRWFGSRAQLLDKVCERLAEQFTSAARAEARGKGDDRVCDYARHVMNASTAFPPVRSFVTREPQLALRVLLGEGGSVHRLLSEQTRAEIHATRSPTEARRLDKHVEVIVQLATALVWATFMVGDEPQIDATVEIIRLILSSGRSEA